MTIEIGTSTTMAEALNPPKLSTPLVPSARTVRPRSGPSGVVGRSRNTSWAPPDDPVELPDVDHERIGGEPGERADARAGRTVFVQPDTTGLCRKGSRCDSAPTLTGLAGPTTSRNCPPAALAQRGSRTPLASKPSKVTWMTRSSLPLPVLSILNW